MNNTTSNAIFNELLDDIIALRIMPGDKLSENKISSKYNVSRTIVRSVLQLLEEMGFVYIRPKSGTFVTEVDLKYIKSTLLIRLSMEKEMCLRIMADENKRIKLLKKLKAICDEQEKYVDDESYIKRFAKLDTKFHETIVDGDYENYGSMAKLIEVHLYHISRWRNITVLGGISMRTLLDEHRAIVKAIEKKDCFGIADAMDRHINKIMYTTTKLDDDFGYYFK